MKSKSDRPVVGCALLLCFAAGCAFSAGHVPNAGGESTPPTVLSSSPVNGAIDVPLTGSVSATFSETMDPATLTVTTFTVTEGATAIPVDGTVIYAASTVVFTPTGSLASDGVFTATITTEALSASGVALATQYTWSFTGDALAAGPPPVNLGTAGTYVVLSQAGIKGITATVVGDLGVSPIDATSITGLSLSADLSNTFSKSSQVTGRVYAANYTEPTPTNLIASIADMHSAYTDAAARPSDFNEMAGGNLNGLDLAPGVYRWSTAVSLATNVTLTGSRKAVWIFQIAETVDLGANATITLAGGALPSNVFWQVKGAVTVAAGGHVQGIVLAKTAVTLAANVSVTGRLMVQTFANIDGSTVVQPAL